MELPVFVICWIRYSGLLQVLYYRADQIMMIWLLLLGHWDLVYVELVGL